jgi:hypothetical protein
MSHVRKLIVLLGLFVAVDSAHAAGKVREVSVKKILKAGGVYTLDPSEKQIGIRVRTSESIRPRGGKSMATAASKKEGRVLFVGGEGKYLAELKNGNHTITIVRGEAAKSQEKSQAKPRERERPRLNPDIERYTTDGKIDFSKLHSGLYGGGY